MAAALALLLIGCMLQGSMSREFKVTIPETMSVLSGSCVTIPCIFDIESNYDGDLDETCHAIWKNQDSVVFDSTTPQQSEIKGTFQGNLQSKNCTTTLTGMQPQHGNEYLFRLQCNNKLKWLYKQQILRISVKDEPPSPTLSPTTLEVAEGTTVRLTCSAPAPCLSHPPTLSWSPRVGKGQETLQVNPDKTEFKMSEVNFTPSALDHGQSISCTAVYPKQDGSEVSARAELTAHVLFAPQILASSECTKSAQQLNCSCETVGSPAPTLQWLLNGVSVNQSDGFTISMERRNATCLKSIITVSLLQLTDPSTLLCQGSNSKGSATQRFYIYSLEPQATAVAPQILASSECTKSAQQLNCSCETVGSPAPTLQWLLNGVSVNQSDGFTISIEHLNATSLKSIITVSQLQWTDPSTLLCHSSNSKGSATQQFYIYSLEPQATAGLLTLLVFTTTVGILLLIVCVLLLVIRVQKIHHSRHEGGTTEPDCRVSVSEDGSYENIDVLTEACVTYHGAAQGRQRGSAFKQN